MPRRQNESPGTAGAYCTHNSTPTQRNAHISADCPASIKETLRLSIGFVVAITPPNKRPRYRVAGPVDRATNASSLPPASRQNRGKQKEKGSGCITQAGTIMGSPYFLHGQAAIITSLASTLYFSDICSGCFSISATTIRTSCSLLTELAGQASPNIRSVCEIPITTPAHIPEVVSRTGSIFATLPTSSTSPSTVSLSHVLQSGRT